MTSLKSNFVLLFEQNVADIVPAKLPCFLESFGTD